VRVSVIIPAYNEASRIGAVIEALRPLPEDWELIVVNDGSGDGTSAAARAFPEARVLDLPSNQGKGGAMWAGALAARAGVLAFVDADLRGLKRAHVEALVRPVLAGEAEMTVGLFRGGRGATDFSHRITPWVSGQRGLQRGTFLSLPEAADSLQGIEALLTREARARRWRVRYVPWPGVTHAMKEEKLGLARGFAARLRMYGEVVRGLLPALPRRKEAAGKPERRPEHRPERRKA
jgi:glycosyltransferase involved in cell wall biosynthesis